MKKLIATLSVLAVWASFSQQAAAIKTEKRTEHKNCVSCTEDNDCGYECGCYDGCCGC